MRRWATFVTTRPLLVIGVVLLLTLVSLAGIVDPISGLPRLGIDSSPESLLPSDGVERRVYDRARVLFGADEPTVIVLAADDLFTVENLRRLDEVTRAVAGVDGVDRVLSLATVTDVRYRDDFIDVAPFLDELPTTQEEAEVLRAQAQGNPLLMGTLMSKDGRATALLVFVERMSDQELVARKIAPRIESTAREAAGDLELWISGGPYLKVIMGDIVVGELSYQMPLIFLILGLVLVVATRSISGVVLPLLSILVALVWTLGTLGWLGLDLNLITILVPALVLTVGFAYAMHVVTEYQELVRESEPSDGGADVVRKTLIGVGLPVVVTGLTTAAGFISLAAYPIIAVRQFGLYSLMAVLFTVATSLSLVPAVLSLFKPSSRLREAEKESPLHVFADKVGGWVVRHRRAVIVASFGVMIVAVAGVPRIRVAAEFAANWDPEHPIRRDHEVINERLGGAREIRILLESDTPGALKDPENLRAIEELQIWLEAQPEVGNTTSVVDYIKLLHRVMREDDPEYFKIPESRRMVAQLLLFGASDDLLRFVDAENKVANIVIASRVADSDVVAAFVERLEERMESLPRTFEATVTGIDVVLGAVVDDVARGQVVSITLAFGLIYIVLWIMFTSPRVALIALFPNFLPIAVYFGVLGYTGITLNPSTSLVGCLALGIAVDDTIHFFARFNAAARKQGDEKSGAQAALRGLIRPITFTTVGLCLGFLVLTLSEQRGQADFGLLAALTLFAAWAADVTLSPALCTGLRIVTLWDLLRIDLGEAPQHEIALLEGLSNRQARVFALMADLVNLPAGHRLFVEGERGDDMYAIVSGDFVAWIERHGERREFGTMGPGDLVGEVGYFAAERTANVDATSDAVLIRFDSEDLERLRRQYPRAGAVVYRNLNRILAQRVKTTRDQI